MTRYEYKVVPAPTSGLKAKGVKTSEARFAHALETLMNELGADGWTYVRADTLPCEERSGLTGRVTKYQNMLVFQRALPAEEKTEVAGLLTAPAPEPPVAPAPAPEPALEPTADDDRQPSPNAPALGPAEPRLTRSEAPDTSAAARAAAAALRPFRTQSQAQGQAAHTPEGARGPGVAAE